MDYNKIMKDNYKSMDIFRNMFKAFCEKYGYKYHVIDEVAMPELDAFKKGCIEIKMIQFLDPFSPCVSVQGRYDNGDLTTIFYFNIFDPFKDSEERFNKLLTAVESYLDIEIPEEDRREF